MSLIRYSPEWVAHNDRLLMAFDAVWPGVENCVRFYSNSSPSDLLHNITAIYAWIRSKGYKMKIKEEMALSMLAIGICNYEADKRRWARD